MTRVHTSDFDPAAFLAIAGIGKRILELEPKQDLFAQGTPGDAVFFIQEGQAKLTVLSKSGKEATITLLTTGDFVGEECLVGVQGPRLSSATTITACKVMRIERAEMVRVMHDEQSFSDMFLAFLLARAMRIQAELVDRLFSSSEKRLARTLLMLTGLGVPHEFGTLIPRVTQEELAVIVGTTRSRISFFMNRFRKLGFIDYDGRIRVHQSLINVTLHD